MTTSWTVAFLALWAVVVLISVVLIGVLRRIGAVLEGAESILSAGAPAGSMGGLAVGTIAPEFRVALESGDEISSRELIVAPTILVFMEAGCHPCKEVAGTLGGVVDHIEDVPFAVVLHAEEGRPEWLSPSIRAVYQRGKALSRAFENIATPQAYVIDPTGFVLFKRLVGSMSDLRELAAQTTRGGDAAALLSGTGVGA